MNLIRLQPFQELTSLRQAMDRLFEDGPGRPFRLAPAFDEGLAPAVDVYETTDELLVKAPLPGVKPEELDINIADNILTIKGETKVEHEDKQGNYLRKECHYGAFARSLALPAGLNTNKADANLESGMLTLTIPKAEEARPKVVEVKAKQITESKKAETKS